MTRLLGLALLATLVAPPTPAAVAAASDDVARAAPADSALVNTEPPAVQGTARQGRVLRAFPGRWTPRREETGFRWLRDGDPIRGARERRYRPTALDVGHRLTVLVKVRAEGFDRGVAESAPTAGVAHATRVRRRVTYSVTTRGRVIATMTDFRRLAQETYDDARGWRAGGVEFRRVRRRGDFSLVLAEARTLPSFSPACSVQWSCRVGRWVVINQARWRHASPAWRRAGRSLRDYRHLVVNHETGHWLGRGHTGCGRRGGPAPAMMQQSKGADGCRFNPWPLQWELVR